LKWVIYFHLFYIYNNKTILSTFCFTVSIFYKNLVKWALTEMLCNVTGTTTLDRECRSPSALSNKKPSINWTCYCIVHVYVVIFFLCFLGGFADLFYRLFIYVLPLEIQLSRWEGLHSFKQLTPIYLARTWISTVVCRCLFVFSEIRLFILFVDATLKIHIPALLMNFISIAEHKFKKYKQK
jgi:hypothetical protein